MEKEEKLLSMSLGEHLEELRYRLFMAIIGALGGFIVCIMGGKYLMRLVVWPYKVTMEKAGGDPKLQAILPSEQFIVFVKCSLVFGVVLAAPWIFYHLWKFLAPGLYTKEKRFIHFISPASAVLFMSGAVMFITVIAPLTLKFFIQFDTGVDFIEVAITLSSYVNFVLSLTLVFGAAFQLPLAIIFAEQMGLISIELLNKGRKIVIISLLVIAAVLTPPDVVSQIALAVPMYALYESSVLTCIILRRRARRKAKPN